MSSDPAILSRVSVRRDGRGQLMDTAFVNPFHFASAAAVLVSVVITVVVPFALDLAFRNTTA